MRKLKILLVLVAVISLFSCKKTESSYDQEAATSSSDDEPTEAYPDGTYCAEVDYYNPDTGTRSTYTLNVEVEDNELRVIQWPNGGWLDSSHFSSEELDSDGNCSITSFDNKQYDIQITGSECSYTDDAKVHSDQEEVTCSECGGTKYSSDEICDDCKRKKQDIADHTCQRCGQHDSFMWRGDELCSDCERADKDKERQERIDNEN
jgi:hypothetical protein